MHRITLAALVALLLSGAPGVHAQTARHVREALVAEPGSATLSVALSDALRWEGSLVAALEPLQTALKEMPRNPLLLAKLGDLLFQLGRYERARETFKELGSVQPDSLDALYGLAKICRALLDWDRPLELCGAIQARDPDNAFARLNVGWAHFNKKEYARALECYSAPPAGARSMRLGAGWSRFRLGELDGARTVFQGLVRDFPGDVECQAGLDEVERAATHKELSSWKLPARLSSAEAQALVESARKLGQQGRLLEALDLVRRVVDGEAASVDAASELAGLDAQLGNWPLASYYYSVAINLQPAPGVQALKGKIWALRQQGLWNDAADLSRDLVKLKKDDPMAIGTLAYHSYLIGDFRKALDYYRQADRRDTLMVQGLGWCHLMLKEHAEAKRIFGEILAREPENVSAAEGLKAIQRNEAER
ncbi:MAG: tetratricopeptide repeat protein [Candidatus Riflebacteria bacterium]|nr:tetratricopeptide repeat protein [Candidatus Riflebacteria bacterium]